VSIDQTGSDDDMRPAAERLDARTLKDTIAHPPPGQPCYMIRR